MKKYPSKYLPLLIGLGLVVGIVLGGLLNFNSSSSALFSQSQNETKLNRLINYIEYEYVDQVDTDSIVNVAIQEILSNLDPHSTYIPKTHYSEIHQKMRGKFVGIGVRFYRIQDTMTVIKAIPGGPSEKAGVKAGDKVLAANGVPLTQAEIDNDSLRSLLKGKKGSKIRLKVFRQSVDSTMTFTFERGQVPLTSVKANYMLTGELGYVKIDRFSRTTYEEFQRAIQELMNQGAERLVLDLRNNGGGFLNQAVKITDEFLKDDKTIVMIKNRSGEVDKIYATGEGHFEKARVYVLINEKTASASEILAGALQDNDRGIIVGRRSFGKGLVQREMMLGDGSAVRLTTARYFTPTGRSIQRPYGKGRQEYFNEYRERYKHGELVYRDSIIVHDSLKYRTPAGEIVYGGGGIIPDVFVPKDVNFKHANLDYMLNGGMISLFAFKTLNKKRKFYQGLSKKEFKKADFVGKKMIENYEDYLNKFRIDINFTEYRDTLKHYIKASLAKQLFGTRFYWKLMNQYDPMIQKVLELEREFKQGNEKPKL